MTTSLKKILIWGTIGLFLIIILGYTYFRTKDVIYGAKLRVSGIENYKTYNESFLNLSGMAKHSIKLALNGREIPVNKNWEWQESLLLVPGWNIIEIKSEDKFGRQLSKNYQVILN